jgi:hypothetical protein
MTPQDIQKLLGGYATGTLTDAEQQALFAAALDDQELFDTLAREQSLRDLLRDPAAKAELLTALDRASSRRWAWWPGAVAAAMAVAAAVTVVAVRMNVRQPAAIIDLAQVRPPEAPPAPAPVGPLGVVPGQARKPFVPPRMAKARPPQLPEPPRVDMPRQELADLKGVIGGVPPAPAPPAGRFGSTADQVQVTAAAPAFNAFTASENKQVGLAAPMSARPSARTLYYGNSSMMTMGRARVVSGSGGASPQPANTGIRYSILRKQPGGDFAEIDAAELKTGDIVELKITANSSGFLSVNGGVPVPVSAMTPYTTAPLPAGQQEVRVVFARQRQTGAPAVQTVSEVEDRSTYVVNPMPGQLVSLVIRLQYK